MKTGYRRPSLNKGITARQSVKSAVNNSLGIKSPGGFGWLTNRKKMAGDKSKSKTGKGCIVSLIWVLCIFSLLRFFVLK